MGLFPINQKKTMSSSLCWQLIRHNNAFMVSTRKYGDGKVFSTEAGNLTNSHSFKYSGLCNPKTVAVDALENGKGVSITTKKQVKAGKVKGTKNRVELEFKGARPTTKALKGIMGASFYRRDLESVALARASQILLSQKANKRVKVRTIKGRKSRA